MKAKSNEMTWLVVSDFEKAKKYYTDVVGLKLMECYDEWGWAELQGHAGGCRIGISKESPECPIKPGQNACVTFVVDDLSKAIDDLHKKKAKLVGKVQEVPGHVKMQLMADEDGNYLQIVEKISSH